MNYVYRYDCYRLDKLGMDVPEFDFRCEGVTSISADLHKFGYTPKVRSIHGGGYNSLVNLSSPSGSTSYIIDRTQV